MRYIYARTSTTDQNIEQQVQYLEGKHQADKIYSEQLSGKNMEREQLAELRSVVVAGDTVIVQDLSRIGRNTQEVVDLVDEFKVKGVHLVIDDLGSIDVTSAAGKMVLTTLAAVATMQREQMLEKQIIGIARAKSEGKYKGRQQSPETLKKFEVVLKHVKAGTLSIDKACKAEGLSRAQFYRLKKEQ